MKKVVFYLMSATVILATVLPSCKNLSRVTTVHHEEVITDGITMTSTKSGEVSFLIAGSGTMIINWGNGKKSETHTLSDYDDDFLSTHRYSHTYAYYDTTRRTITIRGKNITHLNCIENQLISLDVSSNTALKGLWCFEKQLTNLDLHNNTALEILWLVGSRLTNLDLNNNATLTSLSCNNNQLRNLDVSNNTALKDLCCYGNQIRHLDVSVHSALISLNCSYNQLSSAALDHLFGTLHNNTVEGEKTIFILNNPGTDDCLHHIATEKGWIVNATE